MRERRGLKCQARRARFRRLLAACLVGFATAGHAVVLPEDRSDIFYHYYDGGGVTVKGPAAVARQSIGDSVSVSGRYYVDAISSASIDVITTASPYKDEREEFGVGVDYLHGNSLVSLGLTTSKENDYLADTLSLNVAHELNNGLTTLNLGFSQGQDVVQRVDTDFQDTVDRYSFRLGLSQVLTRSTLLGVTFEDVAEDGYLNNPYRAARVLGAFLPEVYPRTRDSQALAFRVVKGVGVGERPLGQSFRADYRYYRDTWDVRAHTLALTWQRYFGDQNIGELRYRYYSQSAASFYSDNFTREMTYLARDKELSTFTDHSLGIKFTQRLITQPKWHASYSLSWDYIKFKYQDFTDVRTGELYSFDANVLQAFVTIQY